MSANLKVLEALEQIRDSGPVDRNCGICGNVLDIVEGEQLLAEIVLDKIFDSIGCSSCCPVEGSDEYHNGKSKGTLWDNPARWRLLNKMIDALNLDPNL